MRPFVAWLAFAFAALAACMPPLESLDFEFAAPGAEGKYRTTTIERDLRRELGAEAQPSVIVVATPRADDPSFRAQWRIVQALPATELETLFVRACAKGCPEEGYAAPAETTEKLMGRSPAFRVIILDGAGRVLRDSRKVLSAAEIRATIEARWLGEIK